MNEWNVVPLGSLACSVADEQHLSLFPLHSCSHKFPHQFCLSCLVLPLWWIFCTVYVVPHLLNPTHVVAKFVPQVPVFSYSTAPVYILVDLLLFELSFRVMGFYFSTFWPESGPRVFVELRIEWLANSRSNFLLLVLGGACNWLQSLTLLVLVLRKTRGRNVEKSKWVLHVRRGLMPFKSWPGVSDWNADDHQFF